MTNKFEHVTINQFAKDWINTFEDNDTLMSYVKESKLGEILNGIHLPNRATSKSAGYDFYSPMNFVLQPRQTIKIPTGIKCSIKENCVLQIYPRSSMGFKYRLRLDNTVGIIDSDYYNNSNNEGHIFIKVTNEGDEILKIATGDRFAQGIFIAYDITEDDVINDDVVRIGGIGSTDK